MADRQRRSAASGARRGRSSGERGPRAWIFLSIAALIVLGGILILWHSLNSPDTPEMSLANDLVRLARVLEFLSLAIDTEAKKQHLSRHDSDINTDTYVDRAMTYIQSNFSNVKISDVARNIGINRSYLTKIFKQKMGISPQAYLMERKLNYACKLLLETDAQIQDIARRIGYDNLLTFSKIFKGKYGVSPKNYRLQNRSGKEQYL